MFPHHSCGQQRHRFLLIACISQHPRKEEVNRALRRAVRFDLDKARDTLSAPNSGTDGLLPAL